MKHYDFRKAYARGSRKRIELSNSPFLIDLEAAGRRLGLHCRADASESVRAYIWRKKCAIVRHCRARAPWLEIVNNGRELPLSMK